MPYIPQHMRRQLNDGTDSLEYAGQLNYVITKCITDYIDYNGNSYQRINDVLGALEGAKLEFYRRVVVPYEDQKREENGDVY